MSALRPVSEGNLGRGNYAAVSNPSQRGGAFPAILWIALIAGTLDISENLIFNSFPGINPYMVFQYIASGLIGMRSFSAGMASVALGVAIHYAIAFTWTTIYYAASQKLSTLVRRPVICGLLYGGVVYVVMTFMVLPLTRVPHSTKAITLAARANAIAALLICIGLDGSPTTAPPPEFVSLGLQQRLFAQDQGTRPGAVPRQQPSLAN
jgi:hypothetical protein